MDIRPHTNPTAEQKKQIKKSTQMLFKKFSQIFLSQKTGLGYHTINSYKTRNKLSADGADKIAKIAEVSEAGFTREQFRPDIQHWYGDKSAENKE